MIKFKAGTGALQAAASPSTAPQCSKTLPRMASSGRVGDRLIARATRSGAMVPIKTTFLALFAPTETRTCSLTVKITSKKT